MKKVLFVVLLFSIFGCASKQKGEIIEFPGIYQSEFTAKEIITPVRYFNPATKQECTEQEYKDWLRNIEELLEEEK